MSRIRGDLLLSSFMRRVLWMVLMGAALADEPAGDSAVSAEARRILANTRDTHYQHRTEVDEEAGRYWLDCSGLAGYVLRHVDTNALEVVANADRDGHPRAYAYHDVFASAPTNAAEATNGWQRVERIPELRAGDLVAWRKPEWKSGESTGHIVIVDDVPESVTNGCWRVPVIHSTGTIGTGGIARAFIWFETDAEARPVGFRRRSGDGALVTNQPIAMARLIR